MADGLLTKRLRLKDITLQDVDFLIHLDSSSEVRQHLLMPTPPTRVQVTEFVGRVKTFQDSDPRFGFWIMIETESNSPIGWVHFRDSRIEPGTIELGYRILPEFWGKGYATEISQALIELGFSDYNLPRVVGTTLVENVASQRVLVKSGMTLEREFLFQEIYPALLFAVNNPARESPST